jgi:hypothetical protein
MSPAKHAAQLTAGGRLMGGQVFLRVLAVGGSPGQLPTAIPGRLIELVAQPVPLGPQLRRRELSEIPAARRVDGQGLAASPGQGLGQLQVAIGLVPIGEVQLAGPLGFGAHYGIQAGVPASSGQLQVLLRWP